jgi:hypothetical protein
MHGLRTSIRFYRNNAKVAPLAWYHYALSICDVPRGNTMRRLQLIFYWSATILTEINAILFPPFLP